MDFLVLENVAKHYSSVKALDGVSISIPRQSIFGLLGPNGAGKTTLIRIITNILAADSGAILFDDEELQGQHTSAIGYMPEERGLYKKMKIGEQLLYLAQLKLLTKKEAKERTQDWMEKFGMMDWWGKKVEELSKGMQQKIQFIATVVHQPKLLILDEPFSGLDPINTDLIKNEIRNLRNQGATIIFSTHRMEQVAEVCDHIALINKGQKVLQGKVSEVRQQFKENVFELEFDGSMDEFENHSFEILEKKDSSIRLKLRKQMTNNELLRSFIHQNVEVKSFNEILPSINEIFIKIVKEGVMGDEADNGKNERTVKAI